MGEYLIGSLSKWGWFDNPGVARRSQIIGPILKVPSDGSNRVAATVIHGSSLPMDLQLKVTVEGREISAALREGAPSKKASAEDAI